MDLKLCLHRPGPPLDALVDYLWLSEGYVAPTPRERVLPSGVPVLVVNLEADRLRLFEAEASAPVLDLPGAVLCGARTQPLLVATPQRTSTMGVHFKAGGASPFLECPMGELEGRAVALDLLWSAGARELRERLLEAPTPTARFHALEAILLERARGPLQRPPVLRAALEAFEEADLGSVAEVHHRTGLSPKRLLALFRDEVGLSPKAFWRVRRFHAALHELERGTKSGAALAVEHGYFDQAHFDREFRRLAGSSPREYLAARGELPHHVSLRG